MTPPFPSLLSFDIFGTVLDWREGHRRDLAAAGLAVSATEGEEARFTALFDRIVDLQGAIEQAEPGCRYAEIVARSFVEAAGIAPDTARAIGAGVGSWPFFADSAAALARLARHAPLVAMTNSDRAHGVEVQRRLRHEAEAARFSAWIPAEELGFYKPDARFWRAAAERTGEKPGPSWWHVSAYADYDLDVARRLGLTTVFVERLHARPPSPAHPADVSCRDLRQLADLLDRQARL